MKKLVIKGGNKLLGSVDIAGAKNAALPLMVASILTDEELVLTNLPHVADISTMANLLSNLGVEIGLDGSDKNYGYCGRAMIFKAKDITNPVASYDLVRKMRASILIMGSLLARFGKAKISLPGGCAIGTRPVDLHLKAMEKMGATIKLVGGYVEAQVDGKLKGAEINFEKVSVGATENVMMAACLADGQTVINNAACEPEIVDLAKCLRSMGADISGEGTNQIKINGVEKLRAAKHKIVADRIEAGTYAIAAIITDGCIKLKGVEIDLLIGFKDALEQAGAEIIVINDKEIEVKRKSPKIAPISISTSPFPGFPTDMQAQFMALMTVSNHLQGSSTIEENIFENRFMHVLELVRMGANIESHGNVAVVKGVDELVGAEVMATDLRASVSLVLAGLAAKGETTINRLYHLERGYENLADKLISCGADIKILY
jgi:UDP-N-acetylglucosamine 1-carboxyvinyltransferase